MKLANHDGRPARAPTTRSPTSTTRRGRTVRTRPAARVRRLAAVRRLRGWSHHRYGVAGRTKLGCPVPTPRQVFAIGLNYRSHAEESGMALPTVPATFTKFPASLSGPFADIEIVGDTVDWEVELVAVIGTSLTAWT